MKGKFDSELVLSSLVPYLHWRKEKKEQKVPPDPSFTTVKCLDVYRYILIALCIYMLKQAFLRTKYVARQKKKVSYYTPASAMNNEQLPPIVATSVQRPVSSVSKVVIVGRFDFNPYYPGRIFATN